MGPCRLPQTVRAVHAIHTATKHVGALGEWEIRPSNCGAFMILAPKGNFIALSLEKG